MQTESLTDRLTRLQGKGIRVAHKKNNLITIQQKVNPNKNRRYEFIMKNGIDGFTGEQEKEMRTWLRENTTNIATLSTKNIISSNKSCIVEMIITLCSEDAVGFKLVWM